MSEPEHLSPIPSHVWQEGVSVGPLSWMGLHWGKRDRDAERVGGRGSDSLRTSTGFLRTLPPFLKKSPPLTPPPVPLTKQTLSTSPLKKPLPLLLRTLFLFLRASMHPPGLAQGLSLSNSLQTQWTKWVSRVAGGSLRKSCGFLRKSVPPNPGKAKICEKKWKTTKLALLVPLSVSLLILTYSCESSEGGPGSFWRSLENFWGTSGCF